MTGNKHNQSFKGLVTAQEDIDSNTPSQKTVNIDAIVSHNVSISHIVKVLR